jgi:hypothetical protein
MGGDSGKDGCEDPNDEGWQEGLGIISVMLGKQWVHCSYRAAYC